ncbi:hypothetical protein ACHAXA_003315 [Cyclostephanos tholiformis]|uniref:FAD-dependent protein C-terminal domain-containing protein n=1 Tax=Cyclostephanos tholiformis TaxID=382380 RepID=A0ABD3SBA2_9STRA
MGGTGGGGGGGRKGSSTMITNESSEVEVWRIYGIDVYPDDLVRGTSSSTSSEGGSTSTSTSLPPDRAYLTPPVLSSLLSRLRIDKTEFYPLPSTSSSSSSSSSSSYPLLPPQLADARVVRRSIDARRRKGSDPKYSYVIDVTIARGIDAERELNLIHRPGRTERVAFVRGGPRKGMTAVDDPIIIAPSSSNDGATDDIHVGRPRIIIVGAGPAGLFCALSLASTGKFVPIVLERGMPVEARGKSIGALIHRREIDPESNFSFGEGGAGTWSDGKLTTRIGRNSGPVRFVLETLVKYGAPEKILVEGSPHLGTDNLVRLLRNMRTDLRSMGGEIHFGSRADKFHIKDGTIEGVGVTCTSVNERARANNSGGRENSTSQRESNKIYFSGDAVVLATGHSARDVYYELHESGVKLEAKGFAVGFRVEHPQRLINEIQYGKDWGSRVITNRISTDSVNAEYFAKDANHSNSHEGFLPVANYRLATNEAFDGISNRGAYSFCQCPGGQIVPSSTEKGELCINGMSFSKRDSLWANSALVVTVSPNDSILEPWSAHGCLAGLEFQRDMERKAFMLGGGDMRAPVQRLTDFVDGKLSESVPSSSYRLGVKSAECHNIYPAPLYHAMKNAIVTTFDKQMPGFLCDEALLHGVETRTSSPVRVLRDSTTLQAIGVDNLFPSGEGAGFAGGIVSAAVDGLFVAEAIKAKFYANNSESIFFVGSTASVGFDY